MMVEETMAARFGKALSGSLLLSGESWFSSATTPLGTSRLGFVPLMDGEENVARLYGQSHTLDIIAPANGSVVPIFDHTVSFDELHSVLPSRVHRIS